MWPKKRRIRLRVLKAVAILRPRWVQGRRNTRCCLGTHGPPKPLVPSIAEGHLSKRTVQSAWRRGPLELLSPRWGRGWERGLRTLSPPHLASPPGGGEE